MLHLRDLQSGSAIADHVKYSLRYVKFGECQVEPISRIQSIRNRKLIQEEVWVLQLRLAGLHKSLSKFKIAWIPLTRCICVVCNSKLDQETSGSAICRSRRIQLVIVEDHASTKFKSSEQIPPIAIAGLYETSFGFCNCGWLDSRSHPPR